MKKIINSKGVETLIFAETIEPEALEQIKRMCNFEPYLNAKIRIMPDVHVGKGCTVGMTMVITNAITPNLVGVDIGCGVLTVKLKNRDINFEKLDKVIRSRIPHGHDIHDKPKKDFNFSELRCQKHLDIQRAALSIGTLGGGNHFIEVGKSKKTEEVYLIIHSGSRHLGNEVCNYYQDKASQKSGINSKELAYLSGDDFNDYMNDMAIVQKFASLNRKTIAEIIMEEMRFTEASRFETIHNYIDFRRTILRKGAVSAEDGEMLLIPINMSDGSLLCIGKGNEEWNYSAPHGAGRLMSRKKAKTTISMHDFVHSMKNVYSTSVVTKTLDEAPQAYKSIGEIKSMITDTVNVVEIIKPIYNFKAH